LLNYNCNLILVERSAKNFCPAVSGCRQAYFTVTSASTFAGAFTLTAMSADRCVAVCCPVASRNGGCRTPGVARLVIVGVWTTALVAVFPVTLYAQLVPTSRGDRSDRRCLYGVRENTFSGVSNFQISNKRLSRC